MSPRRGRCQSKGATCGATHRPGHAIAESVVGLVLAYPFVARERAPLLGEEAAMSQRARKHSHTRTANIGAYVRHGPRIARSDGVNRGSRARTRRRVHWLADAQRQRRRSTLELISEQLPASRSPHVQGRNRMAVGKVMCSMPTPSTITRSAFRLREARSGRGAYT
jgi:hypothetical protein